MTHSYNRPRWVASIALAAVGAMTIAGCDVKKELLEPQNPGLIDPSAVASPAAAYALKVGAIGKVRVVVDPAGSNGNCNSNAECLWEEVGNLTDELHNRHVRFAGEGEGMWGEAVRNLPGWQPAKFALADRFQDQLRGEPVPNLAAMDAKTSDPEWMLFYLRAQAQGAFGGPSGRHRLPTPSERLPPAPRRH